MKAGFTGLGRIGAAMAARTSRPVTASRSITGPRPKRLTSLAEAPSAPVRCRGCRYGDVAVTILICAHREERRLRRYFPRDSDLIDGLLAAPAYKIRGKLICDEAYFGEPGSAATTGLKDVNLALAAAEHTAVPLSSAGVCRDPLLSAIAHGDGGTADAIG
jgi:3-hydroxyisobutyrate dehydrogenase-like beta-hydroxyacid dehydrogenase